MNRSDRLRRLPSLAAALVIGAVPGVLAAAVCPVPSTGHPTIDSASRDPVCTEVDVAAGSFAENVEIERDLVVRGAGSGATLLAGSLRAVGATTQAILFGIAIDGTAPGVSGCYPSLLRSEQGAELQTGPDVVVTNASAAGGPCRIFVDGFESGTTGAWVSSP